MDYLNLFSIHDLALLADWLEEAGELYVDVYVPHRGGSGTAYFIHTMQDLKSLIKAQEPSWEEIIISILRQKQFPLRGTHLIQEAHKLILDGEWFEIVTPIAYPEKIKYLGDGNTHDELRQELGELQDKLVAIGAPPNFEKDHEVMFQIKVLKNQTHYQPYDQNPQRYEWLKDLWEGK